jgi:hypothetical protein
MNLCPCGLRPAACQALRTLGAADTRGRSR